MAVDQLRGEDVAWSAVRDDSAPGHQDDPLGELTGDVQVVHRTEHRQLPLAAEPVDQFHDLLLGADIEACGRLVEEKNRCVLSEGAGNYHPLQLPAGEGGNVPIGETFEIEGIQHLPDQEQIVLGLRCHRASVGRPAEEHIVDDAHPFGERRMLRDDRHHPRQLSHVRLGDTTGSDLYRPLVRHRAGDAAQHRGLAGAVRSDHRHPGSGRDLQRQMVEDGCASQQH